MEARARSRKRETGPVAATTELFPKRVRRTFEINAVIGVAALVLGVVWNLSALVAWAPVALVAGVVVVAIAATLGVVAGLPALVLAQVLDAAAPRRSESDPQLSRVVAAVAVLPVAGLAGYLFTGSLAPLAASFLTLQLPALIATAFVRVPLTEELVDRLPVHVGVCWWCGYDREGLGAGAVCPECGKAPPEPDGANALVGVVNTD